MFRGTLLLAVLLSLSCVACADSELALELPVSEPAHVYDLDSKSERVLQPGTVQYRELALWVSKHRRGWSQYYATPPALGIMVRAGGLNLQFTGKTVLAHTSSGVFERATTPAEYAFLKG
jgi:hypothetical protein